MNAAPAPAPTPSLAPSVRPIAPFQPKEPVGPMLRGEKLAWVLLLVFATLFRLYQLNVKPLHHDEAIHANFCYVLANTGEYRYDPVYHGPVQYAMVAGTFRLFDQIIHAIGADPRRYSGANDFTSRLPAALGGVGLVAMAMLLRQRFGRATAYAAGVLMAFSPNYLYTTRFCREDVWNLLGTCGAMLFLDLWWRGRKLKHLAYGAFWLAIAFAAKENFYVSLALLAPTAFCYALFEKGRGLDVFGRLRQVLDFLEQHTVAIAGGLCLFFGVAELLYTAFLHHPDSGNPARDAILYWWDQHKKERVGGPKTYYLPRILMYEFAIMLPAFWEAWRRRATLMGAERFLFWFGISSLGMYAYLGEKTPWLMVHQVFPFIPLAAVWWARAGRTLISLADPGGSKDVPGKPVWKLATAATATTMAVLTLLSAISLCFVYPALTPSVDKAESVIYVQTTPETRDLAYEIRRAEGPDPLAYVDGQAGWPLVWYLRGLPVMWEYKDDGRKPLFVIVDDTRLDEVGKLLGPGYSGTIMPLRAWWIPDPKLSPLTPKPLELLKYLFTRTPWKDANGFNGIGAQNVAVFRRLPEPRPVEVPAMQNPEATDVPVAPPGPTGNP